MGHIARIVLTGKARERVRGILPWMQLAYVLSGGAATFLYLAARQPEIYPWVPKVDLQACRVLFDVAIGLGPLIIVALVLLKRAKPTAEPVDKS